MIGRLMAAGAPVLIAGCAALGSPAVPDPGCRAAYRMIDEAVERADVRDAEAHRVAGHPQLRSNRFLASFGGMTLGDAAFDAWLGRMVDLDRDARTVELRNLPDPARAALDGRLRTLEPPWTGAAAVLETCPGRLNAAGFQLAAAREALADAARVPDDYSTLARTLGLYPLTGIPVALGFQRWQAKNLPAFDVPLGGEVYEGRPVRFTPEAAAAPMTAAEVERLLRSAASQDPLGVPDLEGAALRRLAATFAPTLLVDVAGGADRIGHPVWRADGLPAVDPTRPVAFVRLEHAWFEGRAIAQLVYLFWFDARPEEKAFDLLAGRLDGIYWRVSLGHDGRPIVYDTIHACGCYHLFFPAPGVRLRPLPENQPADPRDPVLVPAAAGFPAPEQRALVRVAATSHYVTGIGASGRVPVQGGDVIGYELVVEDDVPDRDLRSMPVTGGGRRSLYGPSGIVPGTERDERVLLWPTGIEEPGAMRQWGRHATAFVGNRHFDDPDLIERAFIR